MAGCSNPHAAASSSAVCKLTKFLPALQETHSGPPSHCLHAAALSSFHFDLQGHPPNGWFWALCKFSAAGSQSCGCLPAHTPVCPAGKLCGSHSWLILALVVNAARPAAIPDCVADHTHVCAAGKLPGPALSCLSGGVFEVMPQGWLQSCDCLPNHTPVCRAGELSGPPLTRLALATLGSFDFGQQGLLQWVCDNITNYLDNGDVSIRRAAATAVAQVLQQHVAHVTAGQRSSAYHVSWGAQWSLQWQGAASLGGRRHCSRAFSTLRTHCKLCLPLSCIKGGCRLLLSLERAATCLLEPAFQAA